VHEGNNLHYEHLGNTLERQLKTCVAQANAKYNNWVFLKCLGVGGGMQWSSHVQAEGLDVRVTPAVPGSGAVDLT
jgi:hypothetical protein